MRSKSIKTKGYNSFAIGFILCVFVKIMNNDNEPSSLVSFLRQTDEKLVIDKINVSLNYYLLGTKTGTYPNVHTLYTS